MSGILMGLSHPSADAVVRMFASQCVISSNKIVQPPPPHLITDDGLE